MAGKNFYNQSSFDPQLNLPIFPSTSSLKFRTQANLSLSQQILLDNLWANKHDPKNLIPLFHSLAKYFHQSNEKIQNPPKNLHLPLPPNSNIKFSLKPQTLDYMVDQEKRIKSLETEIIQKTEEIKKMQQQLQESSSEAEKMKDILIEDRLQRMEKLELFPEHIEEVKQLVFKKLMATQYNQFISEQEVFRQLAKGEVFPAGFALAGNVFRELSHKDTGCQCEEGFTVLKCSLDMSQWRDQEINGVQIKALNLFKHGYLSRIILTSPEQASFLNNYWQLIHLLHKFFKAFGSQIDGYVNLELNSIPPCYDEGYPDEARHHIKITLLRHHNPDQAKITPIQLEDVIITGDIKKQLKLWRACTISTDWKRTCPTIVDNQKCQMVLETKVMKVYVDQYMFPMYCPFPSLISQMPATEYHMKKIYAWAREYKFGDYSRLSIPSAVLMLPSPNTEGSPQGLDDIAEFNLEDMMDL